MNPILSSSFSRIVGSQRGSSSQRGSIETDDRGFYKNMSGLERASTRLADRAVGREMLLQKQKAEEEALLEEKKAAQERKRLNLMAQLGMK